MDPTSKKLGRIVSELSNIKENMENVSQRRRMRGETSNFLQKDNRNAANRWFGRSLLNSEN